MPATREFVEFIDPEDASVTWSVDITFLTSRWQCIFGNGCKGVYPAESGKATVDGGCCTLGAYMDDEKEVRRIRSLAKQLSPEDWQFRDVGIQSGFLVNGDKENGPKKTRIYKGACIFANREGFEGGIGCAFHHHATRIGVHPADLKPHVCWMLPLRDDDTEWDEGGNATRKILTEYSLKDWGDGVEFTWYCIDRPEAFANPAGMVFRTQEYELRKMVGDKLYEEIAVYIQARIRRRLPFIDHPTQAKRVELSRSRQPAV
ncbi:MAG: hypothetical protein ABR548_13700 [Actinomycetota bacterium]|nr:hypothetical protein [Actinomycetota bacterium]